MDDTAEQTSHPHSSARGRLRRRARSDLRAQILQTIEDYWHQHRRPPTIREIGTAVGIEAPGHVAYHVAILERQGLLSREPGMSRGLLPTQPAHSRGSSGSSGFGGQHVLVLGAIAAGEPLEQFDVGEPERLEYDELAPEMSSVTSAREQAVYALQVRGTSMIDEGILNGDYVLIAPSATVAKGAIGVAIHHSANGGRGAATLKRIFIHSHGVRLQPANPKFTAHFIDAEEWDREWSVQGTVIGVYRSYSHGSVTIARPCRP